MDDGTLLDLVRSQDRRAFELLFERHWEASLNAARRWSEADAVDVAQDVWAQVWAQPPRLERGLFRPWLMTAARYRAQRLAHRRSRTEASPPSTMLGTATSPSERVARIEIREQVWQAFDRGELTELDVLWVAMLSEDDRPPSTEVAGWLGISGSAVRDQFRRTLRKVRRALSIDDSSDASP